MRCPVRLGAVSYLNVRPLVYGLDTRPDLVSLRFDVPSECARLLEAGDIDLGMIPSIAYADRPGDRIVSGVCIGSDGPVASVALFSRVPVDRIRSLALDTSSRTSAVLTRILCRKRFHIDPVFMPHTPDLGAMLAKADAALMIGDNALFVDPAAYGAMKVDLGREWTEMTGLPFVWAFWSGRPSAVEEPVLTLLRTAVADGMAHVESIAESYCGGRPERVSSAVTYLRENLVFTLDQRALSGLSLYYREAHALGLTEQPPPLPLFF